MRATYYMGSFSLFLFIVLTVTGILLMFYYHPAVPQAYNDMKDLRFVVANGVFLRNLHRLAAQLMVVTVFWHMFHVFYRGGYKPPHEFNWVDRGRAAPFDPVSQLYRIPSSMGPAGFLGHHRRNEYNFLCPVCGAAHPVSFVGRDT